MHVKMCRNQQMHKDTASWNKIRTMVLNLRCRPSGYFEPRWSWQDLLPKSYNVTHSISRLKTLRRSLMMLL